MWNTIWVTQEENYRKKQEMELQVFQNDKNGQVENVQLIVRTQYEKKSCSDYPPIQMKDLASLKAVLNTLNLAPEKEWTH